MAALRRLLPIIATVALLAGCLPSSCRRIESRDISPADSLSRRMASVITPDSLQSFEPLRVSTMAWPRTVFFASDGSLYASDVESARIFEFSSTGDLRREIAGDSLKAPYIAGLRGDTLLVFNPEARRIDFLLQGAFLHSVSLPRGIPREALLYAAAGPVDLYLKVTGRNLSGYILRIGGDGVIRARTPLSGSEWRNAGQLRVWGDTLLSLSGFLPMVDIVPADLSRLPDSLALKGFDSPMLRRTYGFLKGETRQAPLLSGSAAAAGGLLFVLNMRPGWLRVDVYDWAGILRHILLGGEPGYDKRFYPMDIAVRPLPDGSFDLAVAVKEPVPEVRRFRWAGDN